MSAETPRTVPEPVPGTAPVRAEPPTVASGVGPALDLARGGFLVLSVAMVAVLAPRPPALEPAVWSGFTLQDLVFPLFVAFGGVGLALARHAGVGRGTTVRLGMFLLLAGLAYNVVEAGRLAPDTLRWTGELQVYGVLVLVVGLLHAAVRGPWAWAVVALVATTGQAVLLRLWELGCPTEELTPRCNPSLTLDGAWLGTSHMYAGGALGHDPAGLVATLGAVATVSSGVAAGHLALRHGGRLVPACLLAWSGVLALGALTAAWLLPTIAGLWTPTLALAAAALGVALLALALGLLALPVRGGVATARRVVTWPLVATGRQHLLVFFGSQLMMVLLTRGDPGPAAWIGEWGEPYALGHNRAAVVAVLLPPWVALACLLRRRRIRLWAP